jgi:cytochrome c oxidase assembly protein subunit 15
MNLDSQNLSAKVYKISLFLSILVWINILFGPLVRATGSGLACPDWPLCYGKVLPPAEFRIYMEVGHRFYSGIISLFFLYLVIIVFKENELRKKYAIKTVLAVIVLIFQIALGALTVTMLLDSKTVNMHLLNAVIFLTILSSICIQAKKETENIQPLFSKSILHQPILVLLVFTGIMVFVQLYMGGRVSSNYAGLACLEWPTCNKGVWFPSFAGPVGYQIQHRLMAYLVLILTSFSSFLLLKMQPDRLTKMLSYTSIILVWFQVLLGVLNVLLGLPTLLTGFHTAIGVALFLSVYLMMYNFIYFSREPL